MNVNDLIEERREDLKSVGIYYANFYDITEVNDITHKHGFSYACFYNNPPRIKLLVEVLDEDFDKITPLMND